MIVLSWHSIPMEKYFKISSLLIIPFNPTSMFLNFPIKKSMPKLSTFEKSMNFLEKVF